MPAPVLESESLRLIVSDPAEVLAWVDVKYAFASGRVQTVRAHTLREHNASTRVLAKCGFKYVGEVVEPDDGLVWRWEIRDRP